VLENCHLSEADFLPKLERIVELIQDDNYHPDFHPKEDHEFRLWLTSMPDDSFPQSIL